MLEPERLVGATTEFDKINAKLFQMCAHISTLFGLESYMLKFDRVDLDSNRELWILHPLSDGLDDLVYDSGAVL